MPSPEQVLEDLVRTYEAKFRLLDEKLDAVQLGTSYRVIERTFSKTNINDNTATDIFRIETTNETGSSDGGVYSVFVQAVIAHDGESSQAEGAVKSFTAHWGRVVQGSAAAGVNTAVSEISETASAAINAASQDIGTVTLSLQENTEYQNDVQLTIDLTGAGADIASVTIFVRLVWYGFLTPPELTQL